jgi:GNAT superfamily N-acetyltransferase
MAHGLVAEPMHSRPRSEAQLAELFAGGWPAFIQADPVTARHISRVRELFADFEVVLVDPLGDHLVAACWGVPIYWDGTVNDLPAGYADSLVRAVHSHDAGLAVNTLVICAAQVAPDRTGTGAASAVLTALIATARDAGLSRSIAPLRPAHKARYLLTPIEEYATWIRADGSAFDPWLRTHERMGAATLGTSPESQVFCGTVEQWEQWSALPMPASSTYIVPDALALLRIDRTADTGILAEPCIWVQHS